MAYYIKETQNICISLGHVFIGCLTDMWTASVNTVCLCWLGWPSISDTGHCWLLVRQMI